MSDAEKSKPPWLVAVWPGMGQVSLSAGYYLMAKLGMHQLIEFSTENLFDVEFVDVRGGRVQRPQRPRNRLFVWRAPEDQRDVVVFVGEAQPPLGKYAFCEKLIDVARDLGVERIFTFAAMATHMHPERDSRVFGVATQDRLLDELKELDVHMLQSGQIGGLNGVLLGAAANKGMPGICLLGEIPRLFAQMPFPKAALSVLQTFSKHSQIELDLTELSEQAKLMETEMTKLLSQLEISQQQQQEEDEESEEEFLSRPDEELLDPEDRDRVERLFDEAALDRRKAFELKRELDRLRVFKDYEDRFLDLFSKQKGDQDD